MEYSEFEKKLLTELKNDDKECINTVLNNEKLVQLYLQDNEKSFHVKSLVHRMNDIILEKTNQFSYIEKVLKIESMRDVLSEFKESDIMIQACKINNSMALKWLIKMDINPFISDENGMTSLMCASEHFNLFFVVEDLLNTNDELLYLVDKNGENALFHSLHIQSPETMEYLLQSKFDVNGRNSNNDTIFLIACRNRLGSFVEKLANIPGVDYSMTDKEGNNGLMYLIENEDYIQVINVLKQLKRRESPSSSEHTTIFSRNLNNESILTLMIKKYFKMCCENYYGRKITDKRDLVTVVVMAFALMMSLPKCNINERIDDQGNTPIMFFLMIGDYVSASFILSYHNKDIDLSIKNKYGISASVLALDIKNEKELIQQFMNHKTFDKTFVDQHHNNLLIYSIFFKNICSFQKVMNNDEKAVEQVNDRNEDFLIISTKLGFLDQLNYYSIRHANFNHQDDLGNTALFYAVKLKSKYDVNLLVLNQADPYLKNKQGLSPMDLALQMGEEGLIKIMKKPKPVHKMKEKLKKEKGSSGLLCFKSSQKSSDEKLEDYIKNYQITNYSEDYKESIQNCYTYHSQERAPIVDKQMALTYYIVLDHCNFIVLNRVNPQEVYEEHKRRYFRKDHILGPTCLEWERSDDERLLIPLTDYFNFL